MFWTEEAAPAWVVRVAPAISFSGRVLMLGELLNEGHATADGDNVQLRLGNAIQVILAARLSRDTPLVAVLALDDLFEDRAWAADRLWSYLRGQPMPPDLTAQQRDRLAQMLRAVDGRQDGASHRMIAEALFGAAGVPGGSAWKGSELRSRTLRLVRDGLALVHGGYRRLLTWRRRRR